MELYLNLQSVIYIVVSLVIPIILLGCFSPLYVVVDRFRWGTSKNRKMAHGPKDVEGYAFQDRWLYNGSTETGICLLSLGLMLSVATSSKPANFYFAAKPTATVHLMELIFLGIALLFIVVSTMVILCRYGLGRDGRGFKQSVKTALWATMTLMAPTLFYFYFRMEWKII